MMFSHAQVVNASAPEFKALIDSSAGELIDLRTDDEIARKGMIPGARRIDFLSDDAEKTIRSLDRKKRYLLYCAGGGRSADCAAMMSKMGFADIVNLGQGFDSWKKHGFQVQVSNSQINPQPQKAR